MKNKQSVSLSHLITCLAVSFLFSFSAFGQKTNPYFYQIKIYHLQTQQQEDRLDDFLKNAYLPALHRAGIKQTGVFKPVKKDSLEQLIYVFISFDSLNKFEKLDKILNQDKEYYNSAKNYLEAVYNDAPYNRIESILLKAFSGMPAPQTPSLSSPKSERIYELRSYESATEKYFTKKVQMFNKREIDIFNKLGFNAVFYGEVLSGSRMPNLMYLTTFNNKKDRDEHWAAFGIDPDWKKLSAMPEYKNTVSKSTITFLYPAEYSDF